MADSAQEKSLPPTPQRVRKARQEGKVPQSRELPTVVAILTLILCLVVLGGDLFRHLLARLTFWLAHLRAAHFDLDFGAAVLSGEGRLLIVRLSPVFCLAIVGGVVASVYPGGWTFSPKALAWDLKHISVVNGVKQLFSLRSAMRLVVAILKLAFVLTVTYFYVSRRIDDLGLLVGATPMEVIRVAGRFAIGMVFRIACAMFVIAIADILYQKWQYLKDLRMTREEVKEERKQHEADPKLKSRRMVMQIEMMRKRMLADVKEADVVVVNPTHVAVALKYDVARMDAPLVVAKGADLVAMRIRDIARKAGVHVVERPELARALYATVEVGALVPEALFVAVANVLAYVYRLRKNV